MDKKQELFYLFSGLASLCLLSYINLYFIAGILFSICFFNLFKGAILEYKIYLRSKKL